MNTDALRAALIALIQSIFPVLIIFGVGNFTDLETGAIMLAITNFITIVFMLWKVAPSTTTTITAKTTELDGND